MERQGTHESRSPSGSLDGLTPTQRRVLELAQAGLTNQQIALAMGTTRNAVRFHLKNLHAALETGSDRRALEEGHPGRVRRLLALATGLVSPQVAATAAVVGISVAGFVGIRAAYSRADDVSANSNLGSRTELYCLGKMSAGAPAGGIAEQRCFRSEDEALEYETAMNNP